MFGSGGPIGSFVKQTAGLAGILAGGYFTYQHLVSPLPTQSKVHFLKGNNHLKDYYSNYDEKKRTQILDAAQKEYAEAIFIAESKPLKFASKYKVLQMKLHILAKYAEVLELKNELEEAARVREEMIEILRNDPEFGELYIGVADSRRHLSGIYALLGRNSEAMEELRKSADICEDLLLVQKKSRNQRDQKVAREYIAEMHAAVYYQMAELEFMQGLPEESANHARKALKILQRIQIGGYSGGSASKNVSPQVFSASQILSSEERKTWELICMVRLSLAAGLHGMGRLKESITEFRVALEIIEGLKNERSIEINLEEFLCKTYSNLGQVQVELAETLVPQSDEQSNLFTEAKENYSNSSKIAIQVFGVDNPISKAMDEAIADLDKRLF